MKKSISIFCALTLLFSVFAVCLCTPASAESVKYVEAENFTLPNGTGTNLKAFTFEDFEYENTDALSESYIKRYVDSTVDTSKATASIESDKLKGKSLALVNNGANYEIYSKRGAFTVNPDFWADGNKVTSMSFDAYLTKKSRVSVNWIWAKEMDEAGRTTGTVDNTLNTYRGSGLILANSDNSQSYKQTLMDYFFMYKTNELAKSQFSNKCNFYGSEISTEDFYKVHFEIEVSYDIVSNQVLRAIYNIKSYSFNENGDYSKEKPIYTYDNGNRASDFNCFGFNNLDVNSLTLIPTLEVEFANASASFDNLKIESVDSQAIKYITAYADVFSNKASDESAWKNAAVAMNALPEIVQNRLSAYKNKIIEHYENAEKITTDDFDDDFVSGMFWSNYVNLNVENGKVIGTNNYTLISSADGILTEDKTLSAVYLKGIDSISNVSGATLKGAFSIYPLYTPEFSMVNYIFNESNGKTFRFADHGGIEKWNNIYCPQESQNILSSINYDDFNMAIYYDWSNYNERDNYAINLTYVANYKPTNSEDYKTIIYKKTVCLGTSENGFTGTAPDASGFKFAMRNVGCIDAVTIYSTDNTAGSFDSTGIYLNNTDKTDKNNGDIVFTNINKTNASFGMADVAEFGTLFISKGSLTAAGLTPEELTTNTANAIKVSNADGIKVNENYNVRINGTNNSDWAADRIVARTYAIYKIGNQTVTVYGEPAIKSNNATIMTAAKNNNIDLSSAKSFEDALTKVMTYKYGE